jgi:hypothetical protein
MAKPVLRIIVQSEDGRGRSTLAALVARELAARDLPFTLEDGGESDAFKMTHDDDRFARNVEAIRCRERAVGAQIEVRTQVIGREPTANAGVGLNWRSAVLGQDPVFVAKTKGTTLQIACRDASWCNHIGRKDEHRTGAGRATAYLDAVDEHGGVSNLAYIAFLDDGQPTLFTGREKPAASHESACASRDIAYAQLKAYAALTFDPPDLSENDRFVLGVAETLGEKAKETGVPHIVGDKFVEFEVLPEGQDDYTSNFKEFSFTAQRLETNNILCTVRASGDHYRSEANLFVKDGVMVATWTRFRGVDEDLYSVVLTGDKARHLAVKPSIWVRVNKAPAVDANDPRR